SERLTTRLDQNTANRKREQWQQVAIEAIKQCGAPWLPRVETPVAPAEFLRRNEPFDLSLVASLPTGACHAHQHFQAYRLRTGSSPGTIAIWIGPEGDF